IKRSLLHQVLNLFNSSALGLHVANFEAHLSSGSSLDPCAEYSRACCNRCWADRPDYVLWELVPHRIDRIIHLCPLGEFDSCATKYLGNLVKLRLESRIVHRWVF